MLAAKKKRLRDTRKTENQGEPSMAALTLRVASLIEMGVAKMLSQDPRTMDGTKPVIDQAEPSPVCSSPSCTLHLSKSRAYDAALEILGAYKLTGNFHVNLEIVLKSLGAFDKVKFEVQPTATLPYHPDCRHVVFRPNADLPMVTFNEIIRSIEARIGFDAAPSWCIAEPDVSTCSTSRVD
jgi:hypothetical protein